MAEIVRPLRATRRNLAVMQSKENLALAHKNVKAKQTGVVRATLGEISNNAIVSQCDQAGVLKKSVVPTKTNQPRLKQSSLKSCASKENLIAEKPKCFGARQDKTNNVVSKPVTRNSIAAKQVTSKPVAAAGVLKRVSTNLKSGLSVQNTNKSTVVPTVSTKPVLKSKPSDPKLVIVKEKVIETQKPEKISIKAKHDEKIKPVFPKEIGFSSQEINRLELIDKADLQDPQNVVDYVRDIYGYMKELEVIYSVPVDYIKQAKEMNYGMRAIVMDWLVEVHRQFKLMQETLYLAVAIFDRYMSVALNTSKQKLQLVGIVCLLVASKYEEIMCPTISDCTYMTDNTYTKKQVMDMEMKILGALKFNIGRPLPIHFLRRYTKASNASFNAHNLAKYFLELMLVRHEMCHVAPSMQAAASLCLALWIDENEDVINEPISVMWSDALEYFSGYTFSEVQEALKLLVVVVCKGQISKLTAVKKKYSSRSHQEALVIDGYLPKLAKLFS